ncbi:PREDICTED: uncharacterized protein LOC105450291 [Wasmannia auropunctata]|uniref:uncharacterized protein LOC105450291 n=1 Tax=Wasmannia auropunctata TaxID=64793 RepID=UPI0005F087F5|nr:PREDICTED: uncharacterized protein LOC105450291 [Wasmannia auropunctata]
MHVKCYGLLQKNGENVSVGSSQKNGENESLQRNAENIFVGSSQRQNDNIFVGSSQEGNVSITEENINHIPVILDNEDNLFTLINDLKLMIIDIQDEVKNIKEKQDQSLIQIQETINLILAKINSEQYHKENLIVPDNKIGEYLPLTSIENFPQFETVIKDDQRSFYASSKQSNINWRQK